MTSQECVPEKFELGIEYLSVGLYMAGTLTKALANKTAIGIFSF